MPFLPIPFWQSFSPVAPRLCCNGSGVVQSRSEQRDDVSSSAPPHTSMACEAKRSAMYSDNSPPFQHLRHSTNSFTVVTGSKEQSCSRPVRLVTVSNGGDEQS